MNLSLRFSLEVLRSPSDPRTALNTYPGINRRFNRLLDSFTSLFRRKKMLYSFHAPGNDRLGEDLGPSKTFFNVFCLHSSVGFTFGESK